MMHPRSLNSSEISDGLASPNLPLVFAPNATENSLAKLLGQNRESFIKLLHSKGALLFRGFDVPDPDAFQQALLALGIDLEEKYVVGLTPRAKFSKYTFSSTEAPPAFHVLQHTEMCYQPIRPGIVAFCCQIQPRRLGETPIFDERGFLTGISQGLRKKFETQRVCYQRYFLGSKSVFSFEKTWAESFETDSRSEVEAICESLDMEYTWLPDGALSTRALVPGIIHHPKTGEATLGINVFHTDAFIWEFSHFKKRHSTLENLALAAFARWFTQRDEMFVRILWEDGSSFSTAEVHELCAAMWNNATVFRWRKGDVLLLDNILVGHGRLNAEKPRSILAALGNRIDTRNLITLPAGKAA